MASTLNFQHGPTWQLTPSRVRAPLTPDGVIVSFGTAPVHRLPGGASQVNKLILADSLATAFKSIDHSKNYKAFTLSELVDKAFRQYKIGPLVLVNVLDPNIHYKTVQPSTKAIVDGRIITQDDAIYDSVVIKNISGDKTFVLGTDYLLSYKDENLVVTIIKTGAAAGEKSLNIGYDKINPSAVTDADIIGGFDPTTDRYTGLELIEMVPNEFGLVPGFIHIPGRGSASVIAVATAKADKIDSRYSCRVVVDLDTVRTKAVSEVLATKNANNIVDPRQFAFWPNCITDGQVTHLSTDFVCVAKQVDASNRGVPFESPSNKPIKIDGLCLADGTPVKMLLTQANYLNSIGVVTAINDSGWRMWGNRGAAYPVSTDVQETFIPITRMVDYAGNNAVRRTIQLTDKPGNRRLLQSVVDSLQGDYNSWTNMGAILGGRIEFPREENPDINLIDGHYVFVSSFGWVSAAEWIDHRIEFDINYTSNLTTGK